MTLNADGSFTYTPTANYNGTDSFTYKVERRHRRRQHRHRQPHRQRRSTTPPVAVNDAYTTNEDTALTVAAAGVLANDTDADGDPLTAIAGHRARPRHR